MKSVLKTLLSRRLSPKAYEFVRMCWWMSSYYFPFLVGSWFIRRTPEVHGYGLDPGLSELVKQLSNINVLAPTKLCRVMTRYGSDKGNGAHNYTRVYSTLFNQLEEQSIRVFELGLAIIGRPGASLRGWREFFPNAHVYGADIDRSVLFQEYRIETFYCDQLDKCSIHELWSQPTLHNKFDIIIEDGLHTFEGNICFLENSIESLRPGGIYIIEDIEQSLLTTWKSQLETVYSQRYPHISFALVLLPNASNVFDNNMLVCRRSSNR